MARAQVAVRQDFEGPETTWRDGRGNPSYRIEVHRRVGDGPHSGAACEYLQFIAGSGGTYVYLIHDLSPARVIQELAPSVWVRSDHQGIQLLARVVFPRSIDPATGQPASVLVAGTSYARVQNWEQLRLTDIPRLAGAQARTLRAELRQDIDVREAFIDRLVLNIYTGAGRTRLWIDDMEIAGFAGDAPPPAGPLRTAPASAGSAGPRGELTSTGSSPSPRDGPQLNGSVLMLSGRPFFPRAMEYQGEPLTFLKGLGFNAVRLRALATPELLSEATSAGVWLVCPPPLPAGLDGPGEAAPLAPITAEFDAVLAWDLGEGLTGRELEAVKRWAEQVRRADTRARPLVCGASASLRAYSGSGRADILLLDRFTPSTTFELSDYRRWLHERPRLAHHGVPAWSTIPTEPAESLVGQITALSAGRPRSILAGNEQTRLLTFTAIGAGARGLMFASHAPLTADDPDTRWRVKQIELLNLELDLIEPWAASGALVAFANASDPEIVTAVLQAGGANVVLPVWTGKSAQYVPGQPSTSTELSFVVPGVPETISAYEVRLGGLRPLRTRRVTGGISVALDDFGLTSIILLTQDLLSEVSRRAVAGGERAARLQVELARTKLDIARDVQSRLASISKTASRSEELLKTAQSELQAAEAALGGNNLVEAGRRAQFCLRNVRTLERGYWQVAATPLSSPVASPFAVSFPTLPEHWAFIANVEGSRHYANRLPEGNFEDQGRLINAGWKHFQHPQDGIKLEAEWTRAEKAEGNFSLRLAATPADPKAAPDQVETPPLWISTPELSIEPGTLVRLYARVLLRSPIAGSPDGLLIIDSVGGEALAERIRQAPQWREFVAYRIIDASGKLTLTFALSGLGEAWIDDVRVEPVAPRGATAATAQVSLDPESTRRLPTVR
ncbi:MAG: hypothetical protein HYX69_01485 [Planctomycetia bacterium]|nr:hypothetical protein [Planctomycetia bacterium]